MASLHIGDILCRCSNACEPHRILGNGLRQLPSWKMKPPSLVATLTRHKATVVPFPANGVLARTEHGSPDDAVPDGFVLMDVAPVGPKIVFGQQNLCRAGEHGKTRQGRKPGRNGGDSGHAPPAQLCPPSSSTVWVERASLCARKIDPWSEQGVATSCWRWKISDWPIFRELAVSPHHCQGWSSAWIWQ